MGIKDLLAACSSSIDHLNVRNFAGQRIAIDVSGWLHRGVYGAAEDWVDSGFQDSRLYVDYILNRVKHLQSLGIIPVLVFDGRRNCLKDNTNSRRNDTRKSYTDEAIRLMESMNRVTDLECKKKLRAEAISYFQRGMAVTSEMEHHTIAALRRMKHAGSKVDVIVSPYEADSQLAYLVKIGDCQAVLTEDSDVIVYSVVSGAPFKILFKFDKKTDKVQCLDTSKLIDLDTEEKDEIEATELEEADDRTESGKLRKANGKGKRKAPSNKKDKKTKEDKDFLSSLWREFKGRRGRRMFVQMCILAGCDYADSLPGVGLAKALQAVVRMKICPNVVDHKGVMHTGCDARFQAIAALFSAKNKDFDYMYLERVKRAESLFFYHPCYDPRLGTVVNFTEPNVQSMDQSEPIYGQCGGIVGSIADRSMKISDAVNETPQMAGNNDSIDSIESFDDEGDSQGLLSGTFLRKGQIDRQKRSSSLSLAASGADTGLTGGLAFGPYGAQPAITAMALASMGGEKQLLDAANESLNKDKLEGRRLDRDPLTSTAHICQGRLSCRDYSVIPVRYPWEGKDGIMQPRYKGHGGSMWGIRRLLMSTLAPNHAMAAKGGASRTVNWKNAPRGQRAAIQNYPVPASLGGSIKEAFAKQTKAQQVPSHSSSAPSKSASSSVSFTTTDTQTLETHQDTAPSSIIMTKSESMYSVDTTTATRNIQNGTTYGHAAEVTEITQDSDSKDERTNDSVFHFAIGGWNSDPPKRKDVSSAQVVQIVDGAPANGKKEEKQSWNIEVPSNDKRKSPFQDVTNVNQSYASNVVDLSASPLQNKYKLAKMGAENNSNYKGRFVTLKSSPSKSKGKKSTSKSMKVANIASFFKK